MKSLLAITMLLCAIQVTAQVDTSKPGTNPLTISGYAEAYYSFDCNKPADNNKASFIYNHNRHNEFTINLAFVKAAYEGKQVRGAVAIGAGTYMNANYAAEAGTLKNIYEASAGVRLGKKNLWLDMGIMPSHMGFESALGKDCATLTRSLSAENTPYYESGVKLGYNTDNSKWLVSILLLNGWQRITRVAGNSTTSIGTQVQYKPWSGILFNYSTFIGSDKPDSARLNRIYHNLYGTCELNKRLALTFGFDLGTEQKVKGSSKYNLLYAPVVVARYTLRNNFHAAARAEYYSDKNGMIVNTGTPGGFATAGFSLNVDYAPATNVLLRVEGRTLKSRYNLFSRANHFVNSNSMITTSLCVSL